MSVADVNNDHLHNARDQTIATTRHDRNGLNLNLFRLSTGSIHIFNGRCLSDGTVGVSSSVQPAIPRMDQHRAKFWPCYVVIRSSTYTFCRHGLAVKVPSRRHSRIDLLYVQRYR